MRALEQSGPYRRLALAICKFDPEQAEGEGLGETVYRALHNGDDMGFNSEFDYVKRFQEVHHKALQLAHWSPTPERDQHAANALHAFFTFCLNYKGVFSASAPSAREILADPQKLAHHKKIIDSVAMESFEACTTLLELCTDNVEVAATAAEHLATGSESLRSKFSGFFAQVVDRISATELVTEVEKALGPVNKLYIQHGSTEETFNYLEHATDFNETFTEAMADKISGCIDPMKEEVSDAMLVSTSFDEKWLGLSAQGLTSVKVASNVIIKGKVMTMIWCFIQLISLPQITGPCGKNIRTQLKAVTTKMMAEPDVMRGIPKSIQDKANEVIAIDSKKKQKVSGDGENKVIQDTAHSQPSELVPITSAADMQIDDEILKLESMMLGEVPAGASAEVVDDDQSEVLLFCII